MTQGSKPGPPSRQDERGSRAGQESTSQDAPDAGALVWPPPEDELDSLQVIPLGPPREPTPGPRAEPARPDTAAPTPDQHPGVPAVRRPEPGVAAPADAGPAAGRRSAASGTELTAGGPRVPLWATILLMLASGVAGFAAAWFLR